MICRLAVLAVLLWPAASRAVEATWSLDELMAAMAAVTASRASFEQQVHLSYLSEPARQAGKVEYRAPDFMAIEIEQPRRQRMTFEGGRILVESEAGEQSHALDVSDDPLLKAVVTSLGALFAGRRADLANTFDVALDGRKGNWHMTLTPTDEEIAKHVRTIVIDGSANLVARYELVKTSGERMVMTFTALP